MNNKLWMAGRLMPDGKPWEILGLYSTREAAVARCRTVNDFVGPLEIDRDCPEDTSDWDCVDFPVPLPEGATP